MWTAKFRNRAHIEFTASEEDVNASAFDSLYDYIQYCLELDCTLLSLTKTE